MSPNIDYEKQVALLVQILPVVGKQRQFALYGGSAINLFLLDLPRLSVDLDLNYAVAQNHQAAQADIGQSLHRICEAMQQNHPGTACTFSDSHRLIVQSPAGDAVVKIEVNPVAIGSIFDTQYRQLSTVLVKQHRIEPPAQQLLSTAEIYAGKVTAMLDRTHPRDLYDVSTMDDCMWESGQFWSALVVSLVMARQRESFRLIEPKSVAIDDNDYRQFVPMMRKKASKAELEQAGSMARQKVRERMPDLHKRQLVNAFRSLADWSAIGIDIANLPGLIWRLEQLHKMANARRSEIVAGLERVLGF